MSQATGVSVSLGRVRERLIAALVPDVVDPRDWVPPAPLPLLPALRRLGRRGVGRVGSGDGADGSLRPDL